MENIQYFDNSNPCHFKTWNVFPSPFQFIIHLYISYIHIYTSADNAYTLHRKSILKLSFPKLVAASQMGYMHQIMLLRRFVFSRCLCQCHIMFRSKQQTSFFAVPHAQLCPIPSNTAPWIWPLLIHIHRCWPTAASPMPLNNTKFPIPNAPTFTTPISMTKQWKAYKTQTCHSAMEKYKINKIYERNNSYTLKRVARMREIVENKNRIS